MAQPEPVEHEQQRTAEALDLEAALQLDPVAVAKAARPHDGERQMHENEHAAEPEEHPARELAAPAFPRFDKREREQHDRIDLRRDREREQDVRRPLAPTHERKQRRSGQEGRPEVVRIEKDWSGDKRRNTGDDRGDGEAQARRPDGGKRRDHQHHRRRAHERHRPAERVRVPTREHVDEEEERLRERRILVEEVTVRPVP